MLSKIKENKKGHTDIFTREKYLWNTSIQAHFKKSKILSAL